MVNMRYGLIYQLLGKYFGRITLMVFFLRFVFLRHQLKVRWQTLLFIDFADLMMFILLINIFNGMLLWKNI